MTFWTHYIWWYERVGNFGFFFLPICVWNTSDKFILNYAMLITVCPRSLDQIYIVTYVNCYGSEVKNRKEKYFDHWITGLRYGFETKILS